MDDRIIVPPLNDTAVRSLHAGDRIFITGTIYTARDAAHKRFVECIARGESLPVKLKGQMLYYTGPTPAPPGKTMGSAGPTTSGRMDRYTPLLLKETGLKAMIGKGDRSGEVVEAMIKNICVYLAAIGGVGALLAACIKKSRIVCYEDLGAEAVYELEVERMPVIVAIDCQGKNLYREGPLTYTAHAP
jgi:fumarate hydratase subunit beta